LIKRRPATRVHNPGRDHVLSGAAAFQDSVILFCDGDHRAALEHYTKRIEPRWPAG
jgi:hypothetical protein